jgi:hypothetical protein
MIRTAIIIAEVLFSPGIILAVTAVALVVLTLCENPAHAQQRSQSFYDARGSFAGSAITRGNSTSVYDRAGKFDGTAIRNSDGTTSFYDARGRFTGSRSSTTQPR